MSATIGIIFSFVAMLFWGFGDFMIQRSTRRIGDWETIFIITLFGAVVLAPFALPGALEAVRAGGSDLMILGGASLVLFVAALLEFEALRRGKLSVVEPLWSSEIIASGLLAFFFLGERLSGMQVGIIALLVAGLFLVSIKNTMTARHIFSLEKAAMLAVVSAFVMGGANFLFGVSSRETDAIVTNFFVSIVLAVLSFIYLLGKGKVGKLVHDIRYAPRQLATMAFLDNGAWVAFGLGMSLAPIGVAVALSESYIIIGVLLGVFVNKERLRWHQKAGLIVAVVSAVVLAGMTL